MDRLLVWHSSLDDIRRRDLRLLLVFFRILLPNGLILFLFYLFFIFRKILDQHRGECVSHLIIGYTCIFHHVLPVREVLDILIDRIVFL